MTPTPMPHVARAHQPARLVHRLAQQCSRVLDTAPAGGARVGRSPALVAQREREAQRDRAERRARRDRAQLLRTVTADEAQRERPTGHGERGEERRVEVSDRSTKSINSDTPVLAHALTRGPPPLD